MRDQEDQPPLAPLGEVLHHAQLGLGVERGGGLVEDQDRSVLQHRAGDGEALALAGRELRAALAQQRVEAVLLALDELVGAGDPRGLAHRLVVGLGHRVADVLADGGAEQQVLLQRHGDLRPQALHLEVAQVALVDLDRPRLRLEQAQQQRHQGGLAGAGGPDDRGDRADAGLEAHVLEGGAVGLVAELHAAIAHAAQDALERDGAGPVLHLRLEVEHLEDAVEADGDVLGAAPHAEELAQLTRPVAEARLGVVEQAQVPDREAERRHHQVLGAVGAEGRQRAAHHQCRGHHPEHPDQERRQHAAGGEGGRERAPARLLEALLLDALGAVGLDHLDARERLLDARGESAVGLARRAEAHAQAPREPEAEDQERRPDQREEERQERVEQRHHDDREEVAGERVQRRQEQHLDQLRHHRAVLVHAVDRVAHAVLRVEAQREALEALHQVDAQQLVHALQDPDLVVVEGHHQGRHDHARRDAVDDRAHQDGAPLRDAQRLDLGEARRVEQQEARLELGEGLSFQRAGEERVEQQQPQRQEGESDQHEAAEDARHVPAHRVEQAHAAP